MGVSSVLEQKTAFVSYVLKQLNTQLHDFLALDDIYENFVQGYEDDVENIYSKYTINGEVGWNRCVTTLPSEISSSRDFVYSKICEIVKSGLLKF